MNLISLESVKMQLDLANDLIAHDAMITELIDDAISEVESEIELKLNPVTSEIAYLDGDRNWLYVPHANISNVFVWEDLQRIFPATGLLGSDHYTVEQERGVVKLHRQSQYYFCKGVEKYRLYKIFKVQYDGGYSPSDFPKDLKRAMIKQIAYTFRRRKDLGLMSVTSPDGMISKMDVSKWLPEVKKVIDKYKRYSL